MPRNKNIKKILVIGPGPSVIGQAAEFDYAVTQACRVLREEGCRIVLINSDPAAIMTDSSIADCVYIEPLTVEVIKKIIEKEEPDSILGTLGGKTALKLTAMLEESGFLSEKGISLLGTSKDIILLAEDRRKFKDVMKSIDQPCVHSAVVSTKEDAFRFASDIGYPVILRSVSAFEGTFGETAHEEDELSEIIENAFSVNGVKEFLIEKYISGWKEIEFEVMRDAAGNAITVCSMENVDPVGVHTGDSIVTVPAQTLGTEEYSMLNTASLNIISSLGIKGSCNIQFALRTDSLEYAVIEVNPGASRSSALASKACGYPIIRVDTKIAIGYNLDEIINPSTGKAFACFEPVFDRCAVKFPKWPFEKFTSADRTLGTKMTSTGEVMALDVSFEGALLKAIRGAQPEVLYPFLPRISLLSDEELINRLSCCDDERIFVIFEALRRGITADEINKTTMIDKFFINKMKNIILIEEELKNGKLDAELYKKARKTGFLNSVICSFAGDIPEEFLSEPVYKTVNACSSGFDTHDAYYYSVAYGENEASFDTNNGKKKILVLGSGPVSIGQGIEFDYCSVHCVWTLKKAGYETIMVNDDPETVSTDYDTADKLYFEPLCREDIINIINHEKPDGVVTQFGGRTADKLAAQLKNAGVKFIGTSPEMIGIAENREKLNELLDSLSIPHPPVQSVFTLDEALAAADNLGYPVLVRTSCADGVQNKIIAYNDDDIREYIKLNKQLYPLLIYKYLSGKEAEVDAISDGENILIPGIMEHIERAGIHSGDSISVYPSRTLSSRIKREITDYTEKLATALKAVGLLNIQFVVYNNEVYVIKVNLRASRTVPYIGKVTGIPMVELAVKCALGQKLTALGYGTGLYPEGNYIAVKVPVFSFDKLRNVDTLLGPDMKSTGEALGIAITFEEALHKGLVAAGLKIKHSGGVLITVRDQDKQEIIPIAEKFADLGFSLYATARTARTLNAHMVAANSVRRIGEPEPNIMTLIDKGKINYIISTSNKGRLPQEDDARIRMKAVERSIPCLTAIDTASALVKSCLKTKKNVEEYDIVDITKII